MVEAIEEVKRTRPSSRSTMSRTTCLARWTVERTFRSMISSSSSSAVPFTNAPPAPRPAFNATAATGRSAAWMTR